MGDTNTSGKIVIITAPSGAGKTSIVKHLMKEFPQLCFSISAATRLPRANEKSGIDYYFMSVEEFRQRIEQNEFAEWEMVYEGKYYGTLKSELERIWKEGKVPVLDIDVKGAIHVQDQFPDNTVSIFISVPSVEELSRRLRQRGTETEESLKARINKAEYEMSFKDQFDRVVVNDNLIEACKKIEVLLKDFLG